MSSGCAPLQLIEFFVPSTKFLAPHPLCSNRTLSQVKASYKVSPEAKKPPAKKKVVKKKVVKKVVKKKAPKKKVVKKKVGTLRA